MKANLPSSVLIVGFGSIGQGLLPLLLKHFDFCPTQIVVIAADPEGHSVAYRHGVQHEVSALTESNYRSVLAGRLRAGDWLINVSVEVSSFALIDWSRQAGVLYLDTCVEPWAGGYQASTSSSATTNYALRHQALSLSSPGCPTAVIAHGANPGLVSHFVKAGLSALAKLKGIQKDHSWPHLAERLQIKSVQIAELDTQDGPITLGSDEFANTWSVDGLLSEAAQCPEMGWGSHEQALPLLGRRHSFGDQSGIFVDCRSQVLMARSWVPSIGAQRGLIITHHEALSIASLLTVPGPSASEAVYRPTVYYAYHPCRLALNSLSAWQLRGRTPPQTKVLLRDQLDSGFDELGALLVFPGGAYWYGSTLRLEAARHLATNNNATTMQVAAGILGALEWMRHSPDAGGVEAESMDHDIVLRTALPFLGTLRGVLTDWQPNARGSLRLNDFLVEPSNFTELNPPSLRGGAI